MRRRLAVTIAVLAALVGEWLGHSLSYLRAAGVAGLQAGLTTGVHDYMVPVGIALLVGAAAGATAWSRAWLALGHRLDRSAALLSRLHRGDVVAEPAGRDPDALEEAVHSPSFGARAAALATPLAAVQCVLYVLQENLERALHSLPAGGLAPLLDDHAAAAWIQTAIAAMLAVVLVAAARLLGSRRVAAQRCERMVRALWRRALRGASSPRPGRSHVIPSRLLIAAGTWCRPPPVPAAV